MNNFLSRLISQWITGQDTNTSGSNLWNPSVSQRGWGNLGSAYSASPEFSVSTPSTPFLNFGGDMESMSLLDMLSKMNPSMGQPFQFGRMGRY